MKLDIKKLSTEINALSNKIKFLRANGRFSLYDSEFYKIDEEFRKAQPKTQELRDRWMRAIDLYWQNSINELKKRVTLLCSIRADHRGKLHRHKVRNTTTHLPDQPKFRFLTLEDQKKFIAQHVLNYEKRVQQSTN